MSPTPLKNDGVKVSWDDEIPNWMESHNPHVPNHQRVLCMNFMAASINSVGRELTNFLWVLGDQHVASSWIHQAVLKIPRHSTSRDEQSINQMGFIEWLIYIYISYILIIIIIIIIIIIMLYILKTHFNGIFTGILTDFSHQNLGYIYIYTPLQWRLGVLSGALTRLGQKEAAVVKSTAWNFDRKMAWKTGKTSVSERTHDYISNRCFTYLYIYIYVYVYI